MAGTSRPTLTSSPAGTQAAAGFGHATHLSRAAAWTGVRVGRVDQPHGPGLGAGPRRSLRRQRSMAAVVGSGAPVLCVKPQRLGMESAADVEREFQAAKPGWSKGPEYHCPFCDKDFWSPSGPRKHMKPQAPPVLRWDWY